jgi:hypothetical protein
MNDEELKRLWCEQKLDAPAKLSPHDQIKSMRKKMKSLDRVLLRRDAVEIGLGTVLILLFGWSSLKIPLLVPRIGIVITIAGLALIIWKRIRVRRVSPESTADAPTMQWLRHELEKVTTECELLRTLAWWYLLPLWIGLTVFYWGLDTQLSSRIVYWAVSTGAFVFTWKLNQSALRKHWLPLKEELEPLLQSNTPE